MADLLERDGFAIPLPLDYAHHLVHKGIHYFFTEGLSLNSSDSKVYSIITPSTSGLFTHFTYLISSASAATISFYEGATLSNDGTALTSQNRNRNFANSASLVLKHTPTVTDNGTLIFTNFSGSGQNSGGTVRAESEILLKRDTKYLMIVTSNSASNKINVLFDWYDRTFG